MYIIGTAGHIDHGKTSLIRALTGIDTDRLPEEKAREMTIDIGFAMIEYPKFGTVSVIDVPGHERFIRNMVVGAWGVDLGLLVVAVDDGWMPQTEDHFRVLTLLGIERIVIALNKSDIADEETAAMATDEIRERLAGTRFEGADIVRTSARTGLGIGELKEVLLQNLRKLSRAADAHKPYLFVDRVFTSKGYGTIVTGTLKNGRFHEDEDVTVLPGKRAARIKKIESHYRGIEEGAPSQRTALNLAGVSPEEVERGHIVVRDNFFSESDEIIARIQLLEMKREIKNNLGIEVIIGTVSVKGRLILIGREIEKDLTFVARIRFDGPWHFYPGEPFIITHPGGFRIIGGGTVLLPGAGSLADRKSVRESIGGLRDFALEDLIAFTVRTVKYVAESKLVSGFPQNEKAITKAVAGLVEKKLVRVEEDTVFDAAFYDSAVPEITRAIRSAVGPNLAEIAGATGIAPAVCRILMPAVMKASPLIEKEGRYFSGDAITAETLPPGKKEALAMVEKLGAAGYELGAEKNESVRSAVKDLIRLGFLVSLDGEIIYHASVYRELRDRTMALFDTHDKISIPEVRDATGLSRKYIIPLLNRMESDGLVRRIGDFRMKA